MTAATEIAGVPLDRPRIMGILNVTPDSFSDGGKYNHLDTAFAHAVQLKADGADILDVGGESTRPGSDPVPVQEELARVIPVIERLTAEGLGPVSIDTRKVAVMRGAVEAGATLINDVSALTYDPNAVEVAASLDVPVILMHAQGDPKTMQEAPAYDDVVGEVLSYLAGRVATCERAGIVRSKIIADPGIGFGKSLAHNLALLANLQRFHDLDVPLLLGASRKRFIGAIDADASPEQRLGGSLAAVAAGLVAGVQLYRVHDVKETAQFLAVSGAIAANRR